MIVTGGIHRDRVGAISSTPSGSAGGALAGSYPNPDLASSVAGNGLAILDNVLSVNVDGSTLEINADTLRVKDAGITGAKLENSGVTAAGYGSATQIPNVTFDAKGRATTASTVNLGKLADSDGASNITINGADQIDIVNNSVSTGVIYSSGIIDFPKQSACAVRLSSDQAITTATFTKLSMATEDYDIQNEFDSSTNFRFTATKAGKYRVLFTGQLHLLSDQNLCQILIYKNGSLGILNRLFASKNSADISLLVGGELVLAAGDYLEAYVYHDFGSNRNAEANVYYNIMQIRKVA